MTLVTTGLAVAGLCAIAIPILIHLLARQRRKPIEWAAMRFLLEAFRKHKRRLQLEQMILLAVRCLVVALLGLALARPILQAAGIISAGGTRAVYLMIDNGLSSGLAGQDHKTALERHIRQATDIVNSLGPGDAVGIITAARPARALLMPPSTDHRAVNDLLGSLLPKESPTDLPGAFGSIRSAVDESKKTTQQTLVYLFSDFRNGSAALDSPLPATHADATDPIRLLASPPAEESIANIQVVSIEPVRSMVVAGSNDGSGQVTVRLKRTGGQMAGDVTRVRLTGDGLPAIEPRVIKWQPGQVAAEAEFMVNPAATTDREIGLTASIDDDALNADNQVHTILDLRTQLRVLLVDRRSFGFERSLDKLTAGQWIRRAIEPQEKSPIQIVEVEPAAIDIADVRTADVVIVPRPDLLSDAGWGILKRFLLDDGLLMLMPPAEINVHPWTEHIARDLGLPWRLALEVTDHKAGVALAEQQPASELLRLVSSDLAELARPVLAFRELSVDMTQTQAQPLILFADNSPLLIAGSPAASASETAEGPTANATSRGLVVYLACAPELSWTNLPSKPLMVPLFQEVIRQGLGLIRAGQRIRVGDQPQLAKGAAARSLVDAQGVKIALDQSGRAQQPVEHAGVYELRDQAQQPIGKVAVNVDAKAGSADVQSASAVDNWLKASGPWVSFDAAKIRDTLGGQASGSPIAGALLLIVLVLLIIETILARRFSHAYADRATGAMLGGRTSLQATLAASAAAQRPAA